MAVGAASVEALCASADTALGSKPEGLAPACDPRIGADAARRKGEGLWAQALARRIGVGAAGDLPGML